MTSLKWNVLANVCGQGWVSLIQLVFIPIYIGFLGVEAYGLIGFYTMLLLALQVLDLGLSQTMNREMARYVATPGTAEEARNLTRTLELGYWGVGIAIGLSLSAAAPLIAQHWIKAEGISAGTVSYAVTLMGVLVALQWPLSLYQGGLLGLQRQVQFNVARIVLVTIGSGGSAVVLWLISPTILAFFTWQIVAAALSVAVMTVLLWRSLPRAETAPRFSPHLVRKIWRFAAGMSGISLSGLILSQLDKWILINVLTLENFGYYVLAGVVANALYVFITPIFNAIFPRFSSLAAVHNEPALITLYHSGSQLMAVSIVPLAIVLSLFANDVLFLWTGNAEAARHAGPVVSVLVIGTALNGLMNLPYALQLAHGWTAIGMRINAALIVVVAPSVFFAATHYGTVGAAAVWVMLNTIYMIVGIPLTHRRLLKGEGGRWFRSDVLPVLMVALVVTALGQWLLPESASMNRLLHLGALGAIAACACVVAAVTAPHTRTWLTLHVRRAQ